MAADNKLNNLMGVSMDKIKQMVDVDTIIGDPMQIGETVLIPVSKISYGFAAGGSDLPTKSPKDVFGGGSGAGISITPVAFIAVHEADVQVLPIVSKPDSSDRILNMVPELIDKITDLFKKDKDEDKNSKKQVSDEGKEIL